MDHLAKQEIDFKTIDVAELEEKLDYAKDDDASKKCEDDDIGEST